LRISTGLEAQQRGAQRRPRERAGRVQFPAQQNLADMQIVSVRRQQGGHRKPKKSKDTRL